MVVEIQESSVWLLHANYSRLTRCSYILWYRTARPIDDVISVYDDIIIRVLSLCLLFFPLFPPSPFSAICSHRVRPAPLDGARHMYCHPCFHVSIVPSPVQVARAPVAPVCVSIGRFLPPSMLSSVDFFLLLPWHTHSRISQQLHRLGYCLWRNIPAFPRALTSPLLPLYSSSRALRDYSYLSSRS
jgi:hypothetical protein